MGLSKKQIFRKQKQTEKKSQSKQWVHAKEKGRKGESKEEIKMLEYLNYW